MKIIKNLLFILILLILPSFSYAMPVTFESYLETVDMEDKKVHETIEIIANAEERLNSINFSLIADISDLEVYLNDKKISCRVVPEIGTSDIFCSLKKPVFGKYSLRIEFDSSYPLISLNGKLMFRSSYNPIIETKNFIFILKLPLGYIIPREAGKEESFFVSPEPGKIYSDGQRIILEWQKEKLDEKFDVSVMSEQISKPSNMSIIILVFVLIVLVLFLFILYSKKKGKKEIVIHSLIETERMIVGELKKAKNNELWQKQLQIRTRLSKVKLSRVLKSLEARGVIKKEPYGKTNKIKLVGSGPKSKGGKQT